MPRPSGAYYALLHAPTSVLGTEQRVKSGESDGQNADCHLILFLWGLTPIFGCQQAHCYLSQFSVLICP